MEPRLETRLDDRYSADDAVATPWEDARKVLDTAEVSWLTTVRADGRPHVTTLLTVWADGALHFTTGPEEQKVVNLRTNQQVALTTGTNKFTEGLDVVVEGVASRVLEKEPLERVVAAYEAKYGEAWHFDVGDGHLVNTVGGQAWVYRLQARQAFGFGKGVYSQTRWRF